MTSRESFQNKVMVWINTVLMVFLLSFTIAAFAQNMYVYDNIAKDLGGWNYERVKQLETEVAGIREDYEIKREALESDKKKFTYRARVSTVTITYQNGGAETLVDPDDGKYKDNHDIYLNLDFKK